ncbi:MAG: hypothetical protein EZS26_001827 [Candidatus Ordinivivax streblomastigis]|uniref:Uncharacterized protein n=1 Tax=Candidatus Ordinivivax streblomastigis TaxID=2540710 RepID=A0A5M8P0T6_9BACT|nr:MAG: hypothetical protein EZS26_001827 [Candidatus Ordinivivax streblomastigis]
MVLGGFYWWGGLNTDNTENTDLHGAPFGRGFKKITKYLHKLQIVNTFAPF